MRLVTLFILRAPESVFYRSYKPTIILLSSEIAKLSIPNLQGRFRVKHGDTCKQLVTAW